MNKPNNFSSVRKECLRTHEANGIGTYKERSQHYILKNYFEPDTEFHEIPFKGFIADIKKENRITEIQTSGFGALVPKLEVFLKDNQVDIVYPCPVLRRVCWCDPSTGEVSSGNYRRYEKAVYKLLGELYFISGFFGNESLSIKLCKVRTTDTRLLDGYGCKRKKKSTKTDTVTDEILEVTEFRTADDIFDMLPLDDGERLTSKDISKRTGLSRMRLWRAVTFLKNTGILKEDGKCKKAVIYRVCEPKAHISDG